MGKFLRRIAFGGLLGLATFTGTIQAQTIHLVTVGDFRSFSGGALDGIKNDISSMTSFFRKNVPQDKLDIVNVDGNMATPTTAVITRSPT